MSKKSQKYWLGHPSLNTGRK